MRFDLFHSIGRIDNIRPRLSDRDVFTGFFAQARLAEALDFGTVWVAESHFSSEVQKRNPDAVIPHYAGEVGLNCDSPQLAAWLFQATERIGFGTAIYNIVGGNGGPIGAADRMRSLAFLNSLQKIPRRLDIGIAAGRFPYINRHFGIIPRTPLEERTWNEYKRLIFVEAVEVFLRLSRGEVLGSSQTMEHRLNDGSLYQRRWSFEPLQLVPEITLQQLPTFVLGSSDPLALKVGMQFFDLDLFNLSFTPPDKINAQHAEMQRLCAQMQRSAWHRGRMPRTVLTFIDKSSARAHELASQAFDVYIEAMRGTVGTPPKADLLARALIGNPTEICEQLSPDHPHQFHSEDRLMLWFEFSQADHQIVENSMRLFAEQVLPRFASRA